MLKQDSPVFHLQPLLYFTYIRDLSDTLSPNPKLFAKENIIQSVIGSKSSSHTISVGDFSRTRDFAFPGKINFNCDTMKPD